jgi:excisionase family DNA binding protein
MNAGCRPVTSCLGHRATVGSMQNHATLTVTTAEAARLLGISRNLAYEAARRGEIPTIRIGRRILVPIAALERLLSERER